MKEETKQDADMKKQAKKKEPTPQNKLWRASAWLGLIIMAAWISYANDYPWLIGLIPTAVALWVLVAIHQGYFLGRARRWQQRQQEEQEAKEKLNIPPGIKKPKDFPLVDSIDQAQHDQLPQPPDYQGRYRAAGLTVALLPALALLWLALQVLLLPHGTPWGIGLVAAEALFLVYLIFLVWTSPNPSLRWVRARFRAELLRREQYLCLTATGPYLGLPAEKASGACQRRLDHILHGDFARLKRLLPLATPAGAEHEGDQAWIDTLWNHPRSSALFPDLLERMQCYRHYRIEKQRVYFTLSVELNEGREKRLVKLLKGTVVLAFLLAVIHALLLACESGHGEHSGLSVGVTLLAFFLPPLSASLLAIQNLFGFRPLAAIYQETQQKLAVLSLNLQRLIEACENEPCDNEPLSLEKQFQALVLRTEQVLTEELEKWTLLVLKSEHEVGV